MKGEFMAKANLALRPGHFMPIATISYSDGLLGMEAILTALLQTPLEAEWVNFIEFFALVDVVLTP